MMKFFWILLFSFISVETVDDTGKGASANSTEVSVGCFSLDSMILLSTGQTISIDQLKSGDSIQTMENHNISSTEMLFMLDKQRFHQAKFYTLKTLSGHQLSLTRDHLIAVHSSSKNEPIFRAAFQIELNDKLFVLIDDRIEISPVIQIEIETKTGYFAPLTMSGTLLVNQVLVSCFSSIKNHHLAQFYLSPIRWYYQIQRFIFHREPFDEQRPDGIHWFIEILYRILLMFRHMSIDLI